MSLHFFFLISVEHLYQLDKMRTRSLPYLFLASASIISFTTAWDGGIHQQIGYIAEQFLTPSAKTVFKEILGTDFNGSIGQAAAWADGVKWTFAPYSGPWHFLNTHDYPPERCSVNYTADCIGGSCAVQQIYNQTSILEKCVRQVKERKYVDDVNCRQALKWIVHITADLAQPLHVSSGKGGSNVTVRYNGSTSFNMHQVCSTSFQP